jgi:nucleoside-diphosphate-sugar epimerase
VASVFIVGGSTAIGAATAERFLAASWDVTAVSRSGTVPNIEGVRVSTVDRTLTGCLEAAPGDGADVLVDAAAFTVADAGQLNPLAGRIGSAVVLSSASVYVDGRGRTFDEATSVESFPEFPVPIGEDQPTVAPSDATYSTAKAALEQQLLAGPLRVTVVRPAAV